VTRGRTLGILTFVSSQPGRQYTKADLALAEELARRAGIAIDNARLYAEVSGNEELTRTITENTSAALFMTDSRGRCTYINQAAEAMTGFTAEETLGNVLHELIHHSRPDGTVYPVADCPIDRALPLKRNVEGHEDMFVRKDGTFYPVRCFASPIFKGRMPVGTVVEVRDITEERRAVQEREELLRREQDARQTAEALNRVGPLLSVELDPQRLAEKITDLATRLIGAEFGALFHNVLDEKGESYLLYTLAGAPYEAFGNFPMPRNTAVFGPTFRGEGALRSDDITKDPRYGHNAPHHGMPEGHLPVRSYLAVPVVSRSGAVLGGLFFGHSRTGVFTKRAEDLVTGIAAQAAIALDNALLFKQSEQTQEALRLSNEGLRRANEDLNQFAYSASHDLQEPLRMVALYSQMLQKKYRNKLDEQADEFIGYTVQGARRLEMLVKDLLAYTQAANFATEDLSAVDANEILENTLSNLQRSIEESDAVVTHDSLPAVYIQEIHLVQLFQNLIGNALKYRGKRKAYVKISAARQDAAWLFSVQDNGIGIDPQYKEQIFGLFKRLHTAADYSGTGIGLAICQKIVERYGGSIWVESALGEGATFYFTVPDKEPHPA
jgi:PAS domain S-box-containing protein